MSGHCGRVLPEGMFGHDGILHAARRETAAGFSTAQQLLSFLYHASLPDCRAHPALKPRDACGHVNDVLQEPCGHRLWPYGTESHGDACEQAWTVDRYASSFI